MDVHGARATAAARLVAAAGQAGEYGVVDQRARDGRDAVPRLLRHVADCRAHDLPCLPAAVLAAAVAVALGRVCGCVRQRILRVHQVQHAVCARAARGPSG